MEIVSGQLECILEKRMFRSSQNRIDHVNELAFWDLYFALDFAGRELWSILDLAIQLLNTVRAAHWLLVRGGYLGQAALFVEIEPGGSTLHVEHGTLPALVFGESRFNPWPQVISHMPTAQHQSKAIARATSTFHTRTAAVDELLSDVLNQLLRDLNYAPDLNQLREQTAALAKR